MRRPTQAGVQAPRVVSRAFEATGGFGVVTADPCANGGEVLVRLLVRRSANAACSAKCARVRAYRRLYLRSIEDRIVESHSHGNFGSQLQTNGH